MTKLIVPVQNIFIDLYDYKIKDGIGKHLVTIPKKHISKDESVELSKRELHISTEFRMCERFVEKLNKLKVYNYLNYCATENSFYNTYTTTR